MAYNSSILEALLNPSAYAMRNAAQGPAPWMAWAGNGQQRPAMPMQQAQQPMRPQGPAPQQGQPMQQGVVQHPVDTSTPEQKQGMAVPIPLAPMGQQQGAVQYLSQPMQQPATTPVATAPFQPVAQVPMNSPTMNQMAPGMRSASVARPDVSQEMVRPGTMQQAPAMQPIPSWGAITQGQQQTPIPPAGAATQQQMWQGVMRGDIPATPAQMAIPAWEQSIYNAGTTAQQQEQIRANQRNQATIDRGRMQEEFNNPALMRQDAERAIAGMDLEVKPTVSNGNISGLYSMPGYQQPPDVREFYAQRAAQQQNQQNWDNSKSTPNYDLTKISVPLPPPPEAGERQTLEGIQAAQRRMAQQDPAYRAYMAKAKEEKARRDRGEDAVSPGPLKIARQTPDVNAVVDTMLGRMKYGDYQQQMGEKRAAAKEKNAAEKARRKTNVEAKARGTSPLKVWSEKQVMQGGGDGAELSEQQQYTIDRELYGEQTANMMAMDRSTARQAEAERTFKGKESALDRKNRRDVVGDTYKGQADIEGVKGTQERLTAEQKGTIDKGLLEQEYNLKAKGEQLKADIANNPMSPDNQAKMVQIKLGQEKLDAIGRYRSGTATPADEALIAGPEGFPQERRKHDITLQETQNKGNKEVAEVGAGAQVEVADKDLEGRKYVVDKDTGARTYIADKQADVQKFTSQLGADTQVKVAEIDTDGRKYIVDKETGARTYIADKQAETDLKKTGIITGSSERIAAEERAGRKDLQQSQQQFAGAEADKDRTLKRETQLQDQQHSKVMTQLAADIRKQEAEYQQRLKDDPNSPANRAMEEDIKMKQELLQQTQSPDNKERANALAWASIFAQSGNPEEAARIYRELKKSELVKSGTPEPIPSPFSTTTGEGDNAVETERLPGDYHDYMEKWMLAGKSPKDIEAEAKGKNLYEDTSLGGKYGFKVHIRPSAQYAQTLHESGVKRESIPIIVKYMMDNRFTWAKSLKYNPGKSKLIRDLIAKNVPDTDAEKAVDIMYQHRLDNVMK